VSFHQMLLFYLPEVMTDATYTFLTTLIFYIILKKGVNANNLHLGILIALSYLTRYQAIFLLPMFFYYFQRFQGTSLAFKRTINILLISSLLVSPLLIYTYSMTGDPFQNIPSYGIFIPKGDDYFFASTQNVDNKIALILQRLNLDFLNLVAFNIAYLSIGFLILIPSIIYIPLLFIRRRDLSKHISANRPFYNALFFYFLITLFGALTTYGQPRYFFFLIPFISILCSISVDRWLTNWFNIKTSIIDRLFYSIFIIFILFINFQGATQALLSSEMREDFKVAQILGNSLSEDDVVVSNFPYYVTYFSDAKAVQIPSNTTDFKQIFTQYDADYIIHKLGWYVNVTESRDYEVLFKLKNTTVYRINY
jgi:4-amino-4-deoxy-L-arabinose transferase-like glycosyltransferase